MAIRPIPKIKVTRGRGESIDNIKSVLWIKDATDISSFADLTPMLITKIEKVIDMDGPPLVRVTFIADLETGEDDNDAGT